MSNVIEIVISQKSTGDGVKTTVAGLTNLDKKASGSISILGNLSSKLMGLGKIAAGVSFAGFLGGAVAIAGAAKAGFGFNNAMEQAGAKIGAFTKDADKTAAILEMVEDRASKTPFAFNEMAEAAASLLPASISSGKGLDELLEKAEILAASNPAEGLAGASFALKEALSGDFLSLVERFNLPKKFINDLKAQGVPDLEIVSQAMAQLGLDTDLVTALANTAEGRWSTFQDTLTGLAGTVTQPLFDTLSQSLGGLNQMLTDNAPQIQAFADALAGKVAEGIAFVTEKATELFSAFQTGGVKGLAEALGIPPETYDSIVNIATKIGEILTTIASYGGFGLAGILAVDPAARESTLTFFSTLWTWLKDNIPPAIQTLSDLWNNTLKPGFIQIGEAISTQLLPAFQSLMDAFTSGTGGTQGFADLWTNTLWPALQNVGAFIRDVLFPAWVDLEVFLIGALSVAITTLAGYWENVLFPAISTVAGFVKDTVIPALSDLWDWLGPKIGDGIQVLSDLWTNTLQPALVAVGGYINDNIVPLLESLGELLDAVVGKALEAAAGLWQNVLLPALKKVGDFLKSTLFPVFADVAQVVKEEASPILKELGEVIFPILQEGLDYVTEAIKTLIGYFNSLKDTVNSFTLPPVLQGHSPPPMANFLMDIASGADQAASAIAGMQKSLLTSTPNALRFIDDLDMGGIAKSHLAGGGQWKGLRKILKGNIMASMQGLADGTVDIFGKIGEVAAQFQFPPSLALEFAKAEGLVGHLTGKFAEFQRQIAIENLGNMTQIAGQFSGLGQTFADMLSAQMGDSKAAEEALKKLADSTVKLTEGNTKLTGELDNQQKQLGIYQQELAGLNAEEEKDLLAIEKKTFQIEKLTEAMDKNRATIEANKQALIDNQNALISTQMSMATGNQAEQIAFLKDFLESGEETIRLIGEELGGVFAGTGATSDVYWDRVSAQDELNRLLEEQRQQEEEITRQKELQQKFDLLKAQVDLLKMAQDMGLALPAGMQFGMGAGLEGMLETVNDLTEAIVNQIDEDLQIASPSKVLYKKFRDQVGGAMVGGLMAVRPMLDRVMGPILEPLTGGSGDISSTKTTINNFNQTVNTRAESSTVIGDFRTMQLMAGT
jgi:hypothetical protein